VRLANWKWGWRIPGVLIAAGLIFITVCGSAAGATAWTQTSRADFESGTVVQLDTSGTPGDVKLAVADVNYLYAFRGNNQKTNWKYTVALNTWTEMANAPDKARWGGALTYDGGNYVYGFHGNNSDDFWRYSISANSWSAIAPAPGAVKEGGALTFNSGFIYALRGNNTRDFWRYNPATNSWTGRASTQENILSGGALTNDGGNYIYAFQGGSTVAFRRYDISADSWTIEANAPAAVGAGGALAYDGNRYIYALRGGNTKDFWQYDTLSNVWSVKALAPDAVEWGGSLAVAGGNDVYALPGAYTQFFWRYNTLTDSWEWRASTPGSVYDGGALVSGGVRYYTSGNLTSAAYDTGFNSDFGVISWTAALPSGTTVKFQVAANNDNSTWVFKGPDGTVDTYYSSSGGAIWSGLDGNRYVRYKAFLSTTDTSVTPVLHDVTITYSRQVVLPTASTTDAAPVAETTATLRGTVTGDGGEACQYRFQYGTATGNYTADTGWTGSATAGGSFSMDVSGLGKGTKYYFRAQVKNSVGTGSGPELSLLTRPEAPVAGSFVAKAISDTQINLSWVKGEGARRTMVRRSTGGYPADWNDGVQVYFDTGMGVADTGLAPGKTYYYSAWSEVTSSQQWSNSSRAAIATTSEMPPVAVGGTVYRVNKALVLAPWLGIVMLLLAGADAAVRWRQRVKT
jgi:hypothetical protein